MDPKVTQTEDTELGVTTSLLDGELSHMPMRQDTKEGAGHGGGGEELWGRTRNKAWGAHTHLPAGAA
jgi:hypothetical protein